MMVNAHVMHHCVTAEVSPNRSANSLLDMRHHSTMNLSFAILFLKSCHIPHFIILKPKNQFPGFKNFMRKSC